MGLGFGIGYGLEMLLIMCWGQGEVKVMRYIMVRNRVVVRIRDMPN